MIRPTGICLPLNGERRVHKLRRHRDRHRRGRRHGDQDAVRGGPVGLRDQSGRRLDPAKDFRNHKQPYDLPFRGLRRPEDARQLLPHRERDAANAGVWEHGIAYTTAPGTKWEWPRCHAVGGKTNFWGRSAARMGDIDFKAASRDGSDVDWPVSYADIAPYYSRVEKLIGVASTIQNRPSNPDGEYIPPFKLRCLDYILQHGCAKVGIPYLPDRLAQLTVPLQQPPRLSLLRQLHRGL